MSTKKKPMRAAVLTHGRLSVEEVFFELPPEAVELEVAACGICGSDLRYLAGENAWALHTLGEDRPLPEGMILGHEIAAWRGAGDGRRLVALVPFYTCGQCRYCLRGHPQLCANTVHHGHGSLSTAEHASFVGFAERTAAYEHQILEVPAGISPAEATLLDGLAVALHAVKHAGLTPGENVAVIGAGPIGLSVLQAAKYLGARDLAVADISETALERAHRLGAGVAALVPEEATIADTEGLASELGVSGDDAYDLVFDTSGATVAQALALRLLARGGTATFMAGLADPGVLRRADLAAEKQLTTSCNCLPEDYVLGLEMMANGDFQAAEMVTHSFPLRDIEAAFAVAAAKAETGACKVVVTP